MYFWQPVWLPVEFDSTASNSLVSDSEKESHLDSALQVNDSILWCYLLWTVGLRRLLWYIWEMAVSSVTTWNSKADKGILVLTMPRTPVLTMPRDNRGGCQNVRRHSTFKSFSHHIPRCLSWRTGGASGQWPWWVPDHLWVRGVEEGKRRGLQRKRVGSSPAGTQNTSHFSLPQSSNSCSPIFKWNVIVSSSWR